MASLRLGPSLGISHFAERRWGNACSVASNNRTQLPPFGGQGAAIKCLNPRAFEPSVSYLFTSIPRSTPVAQEGSMSGLSLPVAVTVSRSVRISGAIPMVSISEIL